MSKLRIALIAEDETDCAAVREIVHRVLGREIAIEKWASKGCSILERKLSAKLKLFVLNGCNAFIVVRDLDRNPQNNALNDEAKSRKKLEESASIVPSNRRLICIPVEELEAWFWSDPAVIQHVGKGKGEAKKNPHGLAKPKEELIKLSQGENRKPRYSTNMNAELAARLNLELCADRCPSFKDLLDFLNSLICE
jgi:Domain of unknown function (DUF4276)